MAPQIQLLFGTICLATFACAQDESAHSTGGQPSIHNGIDVGGCIGQQQTLQAANELTISWRPPEGGIPLNELFDLTISVEGPDLYEDLTILVDATMPAHGHGMNTEPTIRKTDTFGMFTVENMNLHMPGNWELSVLVLNGEDAQQVRTEIMCSEGA